MTKNDVVIFVFVFELVVEICVNELLKRKIFERSCMFFEDFRSHFWCIDEKNNSFSFEFLLLLHTSLFCLLTSFLLFLTFLLTLCNVCFHMKTIWTCIEMFFIWIRVVWSLVNEHKKLTLLTFNNSTIFYMRIFDHVQLNVFHLRYRKIFVMSIIRQKDDSVSRCEKHDVKVDCCEKFVTKYSDVEWLDFWCNRCWLLQSNWNRYRQTKLNAFIVCLNWMLQSNWCNYRLRIECFTKINYCKAAECCSC